MARPPVSIQDRQSKGKTVYEVWVRRELVGSFPSVKAAHTEADKYGGAPGWGKSPPKFDDRCRFCHSGEAHSLTTHYLEVKR